MQRAALASGMTVLAPEQAPAEAEDQPETDRLTASRLRIVRPRQSAVRRRTKAAVSSDLRYTRPDEEHQQPSAQQQLPLARGPAGGDPSAPARQSWREGGP
jgi:hypothetical protein